MSLRDFGPNELMFLLLATRWTILLALITFVGGGVLGLVVAAIRVAPARPLRWLAIGYIQFFMGTPILIQLFMIYYGSSLPRLPAGRVGRGGADLLPQRRRLLRRNLPRLHRGDSQRASGRRRRRSASASCARCGWSSCRRRCG